MALILPDKFITEKMSRTTPKNAKQLCCRSKNWRFKLSSSGFGERHFNNSTQGGAAVSRIWICFDEQSDILYLSSQDHSSLDDFLEPTCRRRCSDNFVLVGVINGIACLSYQPALFVERIWIYNPTTIRAFLLLPPRIPRDFVTCVGNDYFQSLGFLYDEAADEYKIICISNEFTLLEDEEEEPILGNVLFASLSFRTRQWIYWRHPAQLGLRMAIANRSPAAFFKGSCHWAVLGQTEELDAPTKGFVLIFHARDYDASVIDLPEVLPTNVIREAAMAVVQGCLALIPTPSFSQFVEDSFLNVWTLEDYEDSDSWVIRYRIEGETATWRNRVTLLQSGEILNAWMINRNRNGELVNVWLCKRINAYPFVASLEFLDEGERFTCFSPINVTLGHLPPTHLVLTVGRIDIFGVQ